MIALVVDSEGAVLSRKEYPDAALYIDGREIEARIVQIVISDGEER